MIEDKCDVPEQITDRLNPDLAASYAVLVWIMVCRRRKLKTFEARMRCAIKVLMVIHRRRHEPDFMADLHENSQGMIGGIISKVIMEMEKEDRQWRRKKVQIIESTCISDLQIDDGAESSIDLLIAKERNEAIHAYLNEGARGDDRWIIRKNEFENVTLREIAEDLGLNIGAVVYRKYRGLAQMRCDLQKYY